MNAHSKNLPMDRTERRRLAFYHQRDQAMRGVFDPAPVAAPSKPDLPQFFEKVDGVLVDVFGHDRPTSEQMEKLSPVKVKTGEIDTEHGVAIACRVTDGSSLAGIDAMQTGDYRQSVSGGEATYGMAPTEIAAHHRKKLRAARVAMGPRVWPSVEAVAIHDHTLTDVGWMIRQKTTCSKRTAIRVGRLVVCEGLDALIEFYQIRH